MLPQTRESLSHILNHYSCFRDIRKQRGLPDQPMIVGISGCQGSGKTTLCDTLTYLLKREPYHLRVVNFSLDDVYLTHEDQVKLSQRYPNNKLYQQRGQAGSHDLRLATETLKSLILNQTNVAIPVYDKSLFDGQGDRLPEKEWKHVSGPFDIVLLEGWMLGFKSLQNQSLEAIYQSKQDKDTFKSLKFEDVNMLNESLKQYEAELYPYFDIFIHLSPLDIQQVYQWRLEQEEYMKSTRGVTGLSKEAVKSFVDTYMPAYELYLPQLDKSLFDGLDRKQTEDYNKINRHLKIVLDKERFMGYRRQKIFDTVLHYYRKSK
ncbi:hypothetical protein RO3G_07846 [Rhizopus delemar RA 99-880]|uniref:Phosphoribulokinase/uridine kinase domain-containing protein n=1 Tax=Rhizopus delemar (strain RA 99-880 / ATCC MYA-4621 / FGSC 9543 / NRRL 43880) TaxID=246409 RepID=I1C3W1_RHIO9|nr:hypothetical protein RO3G_07846 [Rhizopus delemar RA 99-880]|eukprot:EIE83141.1 hypothetical protein RO3G_07846 [Rhizopus delemar RA 99-880]